MRSTWHVWTAFAVSLAMIVAAVAWLSVRALKSEDAEATALGQAAAEQNARLALWRIDSALAPLVTQESARPYFAYRTFINSDLPAVGKGKAMLPSQLPSPLIVERTPQVLLHFQIDAANQFTSPRVPPAEFRRLATPKYLTADDVEQSRQLLNKVRELVKPDQLRAALPEPEAQSAPVQIAASPNGGFNPYGPPNVGNTAIGNNSSPNIANGNTLQINGGGYSNQALNQAPNAPPQELAQSANGPNQADAQQGELQQQAVQPSAQQGRNEFNARSQYFSQNFANKPVTVNDNSLAAPGGHDERTTVMLPFWIGEQLILARRVDVGDKQWIQGCLLDWPAIRGGLLTSISDLLPSASLSPTADANDDQSRRSAVLPVRLEPGAAPPLAAASFSPVRLSLAVTWSSLLLGAMAVALTLRGVMLLSERRAAFVSAVTHELRTPLTTFRMYAEMLAEDMAPDEASRRRYLDTLQVEADRLTHLVENVLAYSRLERGRPAKRVAPIEMQQLLEPAADRLADRAEQANFQILTQAEDDVRASRALADPAAVEQILFNLVDNACKYAASATDRILHLEAAAEGDWLVLRVRDHGPGIDAARRRALFQPFHKSAQEAAVTAPGVGLGLALCRRLARDMGGDLRYELNSGGACFALRLRKSLS
jgi:signal transduction histidine kinase